MPSLEDRIERLKAAGIPDDEIEEILGDVDDDGPRRPRSISEWKRYAREQERLAAELQAKMSLYERKEQFQEVLSQLPDDVRTLVSFEDVKEEPKLTPALLQVKVSEKQAAQQAALREQAKQFGFEDVDQFKATMDVLRQQVAAQQQQQVQNQNQVAAQANFALAATPPAPVATVRSAAQQAAEAGDVEGVLAQIRANPGAFARPFTP